MRRHLVSRRKASALFDEPLSQAVADHLYTFAIGGLDEIARTYQHSSRSARDRQTEDCS